MNPFCHVLAVSNFSTSAQLAFASQANFKPPRATGQPSSLAYFPFFDDRHLVVAASLNGGNVLDSFHKMLKSWTQTLGGYS